MMDKNKKKLTIKERRRRRRRIRQIKIVVAVIAAIVAIAALGVGIYTNAKPDIECVNVKVVPNVPIVSSEAPVATMSKHKISMVASGEEIPSESHEMEKKFVPGYCGSVHPFMGWSCITDPTTAQWKLKQEAEAYDENGFGMIHGRYAVAMKPYYGEIGDYIDVIQNDGVEYHCIIVDYKGMENESTDGWLATYAHGNNDIIEFVVDKDSWYGTDKTVLQYHPEFGRNIAEIYNVGSYYN